MQEATPTKKTAIFQISQSIIIRVGGIELGLRSFKRIFWTSVISRQIELDVKYPEAAAASGEKGLFIAWLTPVSCRPTISCCFSMIPSVTISAAWSESSVFQDDVACSPVAAAPWPL